MSNLKAIEARFRPEADLAHTTKRPLNISRKHRQPSLGLDEKWR